MVHMCTTNSQYLVPEEHQQRPMKIRKNIYRLYASCRYSQIPWGWSSSSYHELCCRKTNTHQHNNYPNDKQTEEPQCQANEHLNYNRFPKPQNIVQSQVLIRNHNSYKECLLELKER